MCGATVKSIFPRLKDVISYNEYSPQSCFLLVLEHGKLPELDEFALYMSAGSQISYTNTPLQDTTAKSKGLNHEFIQGLQRISPEKHHQRENRDTSPPQTPLAFHAHNNQRTGYSPFYILEPVLLHASIVSRSSSTTTTLEQRDIAENDQRTRVQNLDNYRTEGARCYRDAWEKLAKNRDHTAFLKDPHDAR